MASILAQQKDKLWSVMAGGLASILLAVLYIVVVSIAQDLDHALDLMRQDWYFVIPIVAGFGVQVGLFTYFRRIAHARRRTRSAAALTGAGTGVSTASMVACCAHHATDVLPILGLSGAALFLNEFRGPFMALGIATNVLGIVIMLRLVRNTKASGYSQTDL